MNAGSKFLLDFYRRHTLNALPATFFTIPKIHTTAVDKSSIQWQNYPPDILFQNFSWHRPIMRDHLWKPIDLSLELDANNREHRVGHL